MGPVSRSSKKACVDSRDYRADRGPRADGARVDAHDPRDHRSPVARGSRVRAPARRGRPGELSRSQPPAQHAARAAVHRHEPLGPRGPRSGRARAARRRGRGRHRTGSAPRCICSVSRESGRSRSPGRGLRGASRTLAAWQARGLAVTRARGAESWPPYSAAAANCRCRTRGARCHRARESCRWNTWRRKRRSPPRARAGRAAEGRRCRRAMRQDQARRLRSATASAGTCAARSCPGARGHG